MPDTITIPAKYRKNPGLAASYKIGILNPRPLYVIAREIRRDWKSVYFGAVPYLDAMGGLSSLAQRYGDDSAESIVAYFLANAHTWRGNVAQSIKAELQAMLDSRKTK